MQPHRDIRLVGKKYFRPLLGAYFLLSNEDIYEYERARFPSPAWDLFFYVYKNTMENLVDLLPFPSPTWGLFFYF